MDSIHIIKTPPTVALLGEGLKYTLQRATAFITGKASLVINLTTTAVNYPDNFLTLGLYGGSTQFYFKAAPDSSGEQLRTWTAGNYTDFCAQVAADLQLNYYLNKYYVVTVESVGVKIEAREVGSAYDLSFVNTNILGLSAYSNTAGIDDSTDADYKIYTGICLYNADPALPTPLGEELIPVSNQEIAKSNLAAYLADQLQTSFHFPFNGTLAYEVPNAVVRYFIRYAEYMAGTFQKMYNDAGIVHYAIAGELNRIDSDFLSGEESNYFDYMYNMKRFLTWSPIEKTTFPGCSERLYFLLTVSQCRLMKKAYYSTGTETISLIQDITQDNYTIIEIACGLAELFPDEDISTLVKYEIFILDSKDTFVSEIRTLVVDHSYYLNTRTLFFLNSFDKYEALHCTGNLVIKDNVNREEVNVLTDDVFRRKVLLSENKAGYELNSGWLSGKETRLWLEEVLLSKDVFFTLGDFLLPVIITTGKVTRSEDREHNYNLSVTFEPDYNNSRYSAIVGEGAYFYTDENYVIYTDENGIKLIE